MGSANVGVGARSGRNRGDLKIGDDGNVIRETTGDMQAVEARIASNTGWDKKGIQPGPAPEDSTRLSGQNKADMAMAATVGDGAIDPDQDVRKSAPSTRARLVPRTYTVGFGKGLQIDTYSGDSLRA